MITFPVLAVIAADVIYQTSTWQGVESLDRRLGSAEAQVDLIPHIGRVLQGLDPDRDASGTIEDHRPAAVTLEHVRGRSVRDLPGTRTRGQRRHRRGVPGSRRRARPGAPLAQGLFRLTSGRFPRTTEVAVNAALAGHGFAVGTG